MKKNVLMILPTFKYAGGIESFVMNTLRFMNREQYNFDILTHDLSAHDYVAEIQNFGGEVFLLPPFSLSSLTQIKTEYEALLNQKTYDIVHCNMANAAFLYLSLAKKHKVPVRILHSHQNKAADTLSHALRNIPLLFIGKQFANYRMACGKLAGDYLFGKQPYDIVNNAIDYQAYQFDEEMRQSVRQELGYAGDEIVIGHTGRLTPQKNQAFLLDLLAVLNKTYPEKAYRLLLVGEGEDREKLIEQTEQLGLGGKVNFLGERKDIPRLLMACDLFVFPSIYEGLGISVLEAQASGLYSICSKGVPLEADISSRIIHLDLEQMADWIEQVVANSTRQPLRECLDERYDIRTNAALLGDLYNKYHSEQVK